MAAKETNELFPVFFKLNALSVLVVGGGNVGLEKLNALLQNAPRAVIKLVATVIQDKTRDRVLGFPNVTLEERPFHTSDLEGTDLVIIAVNDPVASQNIRTAAKEKGKLVNVADKPELCDFYLGSIVQKGNLKIAISTNGKSPTIAKRLKDVFNEVLPEEIDNLLEHMQAIRNRLSGDFAAKVERLNTITKELVMNNGKAK